MNSQNSSTSNNQINGVVDIPPDIIKVPSVMQTTVQAQASSGLNFTESKDKDRVIMSATMDFFQTLPKPASSYTDLELRYGLSNYIADKIKSVNDTLPKSVGKIRMIQCLPNQSIAECLLHKYIIRCISWTGSRDDNNYVGIYQESGPDEGLYVGSDAVFTKLVITYKYDCSIKDIEEIRHFLENRAELVIPNPEQDLIAVNNGILHYPTKTLRPFTPDICFTRKSRVNYVTGPTPPQVPRITMDDGLIWDFDEWMESLSDNEEIVDLLWHVLGAILRPNVRWNKIVCMYSQVGMNGKGTLCELMKQLCGEGAYASITFEHFAKDSFLTQLITANAVITDENGTNDYTKNVANLKALVTGDSISIDRKYKQALTFRYNGLIVECVNALPKAADQTDSFYRRFLMIPFEKTFKGIERTYIKQDYLHRPEVLEYVLWKVMNMPDYYSFNEPDACKALLAEYKEVNDPVVQFVEEVFPELVWDKVPQSFLYDLYLKWCTKNNPSGTKLGKQNFNSRVKQIVSDAYPDEWEFKKDRVCIGNNDNSRPERLIAEYGLDDWRNPTYKGCDIEKVCKTNFKPYYKGCYIKK